MIPESEWQWFGQAGHFICAHDCLFHLHTHVNGYCVSTIGDYYPSYKRKGDDLGEAHEVGYQRMFETMIFRLTSDGGVEGGELECVPYNERDEAAAGHVAKCKEKAGAEPE